MDRDDSDKTYGVGHQWFSPFRADCIAHSVLWRRLCLYRVELTFRKYGSALELVPL